jgi:hypothetical protein
MFCDVCQTLYRDHSACPVCERSFYHCTQCDAKLDSDDDIVCKNCYRLNTAHAIARGAHTRGHTMTFDFSPANIARINKEHKLARYNLRSAKDQLANVARLRGLHYRNMDQFEIERRSDLAAAQAAFDTIDAEREQYRARGFCR